jgi:hypothetical protein
VLALQAELTAAQASFICFSSHLVP